jgi:dTDP-glucose pyrophosphorylase
MIDECANTIRGGDSIGSAFERICAGRLGVLVVVGPGRELLGTVSDASLRRAVLAGKDLDTPVEQIMSRQPVLADDRATDDEIVGLLQTHRLRSIPRVADGRLVGISSLDEVAMPRGRHPVAVVMVGGQGERLRPLTDKVPKPLLKIGGVSIVERLIIAATSAGVRDVYLTLNYKADMFEERLGTGDHLGVSLHYIREREPMGTAGALSLLPGDLVGPVLVMNGDVVTTLDFRTLLDFHWHQRGVITVAGVEHRSPIPYGVLRAVGHRLVGIDEKPHRRDFVAAGIYELDASVLRFVPHDGPSGMPDLIDCVIGEGLPVNVFPILERWFDIGSREEFDQVLVHFALGEESEEA